MSNWDEFLYSSSKTSQRTVYVRQGYPGAPEPNSYYDFYYKRGSVSFQPFSEELAEVGGNLVTTLCGRT